MLGVVKDLHHYNAITLLALAVVLALWATYSYIRKRTLQPRYLSVYGFLFSLTVLQGLLGILGYLLGGRPGEFVHVAYGVFALIFLPGAYFSSRPGGTRNETLVLAIACWVVSIVYLRGIVTG